MDEITEKECTKCKRTLAIKYFEFRSDTNKFRNQCKMCNKGYKSFLFERQDETFRLFSAGLKKCGRCGEIKKLSHFNMDKQTTTGLTSFCRKCTVEKGIKERADPKIYSRQKMLRYGVTESDMDAYNSTHNCEICGKPISGRKKCLDHDHSSGRYRGALCYECNMGIGFLKDSIKILESSIEYIKKSLL